MATEISTPSRAASLFWSCASFDFYRRIAENRAGRTVSYLLLMAAACAVAVTAFFMLQVLPPLQAAARAVPAMVLSGGRLVVAPNAPAILYDDGAHGMLLIRQAVDADPPAPGRPYDAVVTLCGGGALCEIAGCRLMLPWPSNLALDLQQPDASAFMDSCGPFLCMATFAGAFAWFFVTRFAHAVIGAILMSLITGSTRSAGFGQAFNIAAYAMTPGTWLMMGLLAANVLYRFPPVLLAWNWALYAVVGLIYLIGAAMALPERPAMSANPWQRQDKDAAE